MSIAKVIIISVGLNAIGIYFSVKLMGYIEVTSAPLHEIFMATLGMLFWEYISACLTFFLIYKAIRNNNLLYLVLDVFFCALIIFIIPASVSYIMLEIGAPSTIFLAVSILFNVMQMIFLMCAAISLGDEATYIYSIPLGIASLSITAPTLVIYLFSFLLLNKSTYRAISYCLEKIDAVSFSQARNAAVELFALGGAMLLLADLIE